MTHLLDTNVCIAAMRMRPGVQERMRALSPKDCGVSVVSVYELFAGVERCRDPENERRKVGRFLEPLELAPFDVDAARHAAKVRWELEQRGQLIGPYDLMLAGQALALQVIFVTHNTSEFGRVPGLRWEDWQQG
jgi:tRNA(fMet)-specific endonuclease VapC